MNDADLIAKGVAALGARRKMLKVFENIRAHCDANVSLLTFYKYLCLTFSLYSILNIR